MTDVSTLLTKLQPKRDQYGRYVIPDPVTGKERSWTRATTVAKTLSDDYHLGAWSERMVAAGIGRRSDLYALAASASIDDRDTLQKIAREAKSAAQSGAKANIGTALHAFTERLDRGEPVNVPGEWAADIEAYRSTLAANKIEIVRNSIEQIVTNHEYGIAGTLDRRGMILGAFAAFIADLKTGSFLDWQAFALQLAIYAHADSVYNLTTGKHEPAPEVDQDHALIIHLPAGTGTCSLYWVDIAAGWEAVEKAMWVRKWRSRKDLHTVLYAAPKDATEDSGATAGRQDGTAGSSPAPVGPALSLAGSDKGISTGDGAGSDGSSASATHPAPLADPAAIRALRERALSIAASGHEDKLRHYWPAGVPTFKQGGQTQADLEAIGRVCADIEREHSLPFVAADAAPEVAAKRRAQLEAIVSDPEIREALLAEVGARDDVPLTARELDQLATLARAIDLCMVGLTYEGERPVLMSSDRAEAEILARYDTRTAAVAAAREESDRLGRKRKPRTLKEVTADPLLVAQMTATYESEAK